MAVPIYPPELNQAWAIAGFRTSRPDKMIDAPPSRGRSWRRGGGSRIGGRPQTGMIIEPIANVARFWRFWMEELEEGVLPFLLRDPQLDGLPLADEEDAPLTDETEAPLLMTSWSVVRFITVADEVPLQGSSLWQLHYQLLVIA